MNITVIYPNRREKVSTTYSIAQIIIEKLLDGGKLYEFFLPEDMPHICRGCYACFNGYEEKCGGYGYLKPITDAFDNSELIIFCAPVYVFHAPGQIKTLLDHFGYRWIVHRPDFNMRNRQAVIISTAAGAGFMSTVKDIKDSLDYWGMARTHIITKGVWGYFWNDMPDSFRKPLLKKTDKAVRKIKKRAKRLTPSFKVRMLYFMYSKLHLAGKMVATDDEYWKMNFKGGNENGN